MESAKTYFELNSQIMAAMEGDLKKEADEDAALRAQLGTAFTRPPSADVNP